MSERRRVRIESDGHLIGSRVTDEATGARIPDVRSIVFRVDASGHPASAEIEILMPQISVAAQAEIRRVCPYCGRPEPDELDASTFERAATIP